MSWKSLIPKAGARQTISRAKNAPGHKTVYKPGAGGKDPSKPLTQACDCVGFVAWAIGIPRELPPRSTHVISIDCIWNSGVPVMRGLFTEVSVLEAEPGDLLVYPHTGAREYGHVGIILAVNRDMPVLVVHCSLGNYLYHRDAIRLTDTHIFLSGNHHTRAMRVNYEMLKELIPQK